MIGVETPQSIDTRHKHNCQQGKTAGDCEPPQRKAFAARRCSVRPVNQPTNESLAVANCTLLAVRGSCVRAHRIHLLTQGGENAMRFKSAASDRLEVHRFLVYFDLPIE